MSIEQSIWILIVFLVVLFIVIGKSKLYLVKGYIARVVVNVLAIYCINTILVAIEFAEGLPLNMINLLTSTILGFPGVILLYVIHLSQFL